MRKAILGCVAAQAILVILLAVGLKRHILPLGIRGQWEWLRVAVEPTWYGLSIAVVAVVAYAALAAWGYRRLGRAREVRRLEEAAWVVVLLPAAMAAQVGVTVGAADEYDLTKWAYVNFFTSSTGYFKVAKEQVASDPGRFLADYPDWIQDQDSLHIGTHPPGLFLVHTFLLNQMNRRPDWAASILDLAPSSTSQGFRQLEQMSGRPLPRADRAALFLSSLLALVACSGAVIPLYLLVRAERSAAASWAAATLWPLAPSAILFQPVADTTYPFQAAAAIALAAWASRADRGRLSSPILAFAAGLLLAVSMWFSLVFLAVGLVVALIYASATSLSLKRRIGLLVATGSGFLALTLLFWAVGRANPFAIWWWNQFHHARFYDEYPRSYLAWFVANPIEFVIATGLPTLAWVVAGLLGRLADRPDRPAWLRSAGSNFAVLVVLNVLGRNKGEVARLWMPFMPSMVGAAGASVERLACPPVLFGVSVALLGLQTLVLQAAIQVVYPV